MSSFYALGFVALHTIKYSYNILVPAPTTNDRPPKRSRHQRIERTAVHNMSTRLAHVYVIKSLICLCTRQHVCSALCCWYSAQRDQMTTAKTTSNRNQHTHTYSHIHTHVMFTHIHIYECDLAAAAAKTWRLCRTVAIAHLPTVPMVPTVGRLRAHIFCLHAAGVAGQREVIVCLHTRTPICTQRTTTV